MLTACSGGEPRLAARAFIHVLSVLACVWVGTYKPSKVPLASYPPSPRDSRSGILRMPGANVSYGRGVYANAVDMLTPDPIPKLPAGV